MDEEIIDLIYQNEDVEGVAIFTRAGELIESQLSIMEEALQVVSKIVVDIANAFASADRELRGFLLQSEKVTLQIFVLREAILILQLNDSFEASRIDKKIRSIFNSRTSVVPVVASPVFSAVEMPADPVELNLDPEPVPVPIPLPDSEPPEDTSEYIDFVAFQARLRELLKGVAPEKVTNDMIEATLLKNKVESSYAILEKREAFNLGQQVIDKIPNEEKRKTLSQDYQKLVTNF